MKKLVICMLTMVVLFLASHIFSEASADTNEALPEITLPLPDSQFHRSYLGLENVQSTTFRLSDIKADILIIELFSMYCPYCQKEAPLVNRLYEKMGQRAKLGVVIKILGVGASNSHFEVDHFRETYNVPFPLFPDQDMSIYKKLSGAGTPGFISCLLKKGNKPLIIHRNSGGFYDADEFLDEVIANSGL